jgi:hypothetical protein
LTINFNGFYFQDGSYKLQPVTWNLEPVMCHKKPYIQK